ncbi:MAG: 2-oxoglutarate dehydrogenase complex dihydrolipoyllysine-residue succinyltransferase [Leptospiraceae bacterium]|nr:2-oxoglutarate dehydrogenase complex dihydrolipoyllysine-residue succinyltransferase [Leptospiraceae bacterium]MCP5496625.1 2-oxoglutarate dehydrogenase complex dihydrolipoyllysine-residue succinyltransferase [Leptospiraceae bacterium]
MAIEIKIPTIGESITEVTLSAWRKENGEFVEEGDILCDIESDKATLELPSEVSGVLTKKVEAGTDLKIGALIGEIEEGVKKEVPSIPASKEKTIQHPSPAAAKILAEKNVDVNMVKGSGKDGRITKTDAINSNPPKQETVKSAPLPVHSTFTRGLKREKMTRLRKTIATRLTEAKNTTAMLTTFNEVDMKQVMDLRKKYKDAFEKKHSVKLGFMSFFTKACCMALKSYPMVNAQIDGEEFLIPDYVDMGISVSTDKGLVVPVVKNAESLNFAQLESEILRLAGKARDGKLSVEEMSGGTFTITNGGVFGSMLSTPILNIPQSAILGMHNIVERPWVVNGEIVIRPIMYVALSYDHRVVDGKDSVSFLKAVKEYMEDPSRMLLEV